VLTDVKTFKKRLGKWKTWNCSKAGHERWVVYLFFGLMAVNDFQVFIKLTEIIARRILNYAQMSSRAVLRVEGMSFSDSKNETKNKRRYLVTGN
jgi:hypothetical protein